MPIQDPDKDFRNGKRRNVWVEPNDLICAWCKRRFEDATPRYCSATCKQLAFHKRHPEKHSRSAAIRLKRMNEAEGATSWNELNDLWRKQNGQCFYCQNEIERKAAHLDHKTPLCRGGSNWIANMAWACASCNLRKHHRTAEEWFEKIKKSA